MPDLPELTLPRGLPCWLAAGHSVELTPLYADVTMRTGHSRRRRVWRSAPCVVTVGLALSEPQMRRFFVWFEDSLRAGAEPFAAHLPNQGPGLLWWRAVFVEPPTYETRQKAWFDGQLLNAFRVTAKLLLTGSGSATGPVDTTMASTATVALYGSAGLTVEKRLASESLVELLQATRLRSEVLVALLAAPPLVFLTASTAETVTAGDTSSALLSQAGAVSETAAVADVQSSLLSLGATLAESAAAVDSQSAVAGTASYEVLSIPFDGANGSAAITDSHGHAVTVNGSVVISTAQFVDGGSSGSFPGADADYLSLASSADFRFGSGEFAIRAKVYLANTSGIKIIATTRSPTGAADPGFIFLVSGAAIQFVAYAPAGTAAVNFSGGTLSANTWYDVEIRRVGNVFSLLVAGAVVNTTTVSVYITDSAEALIIGCDPSTTGRAINGYIDTLKIFKGGIS